MISHMSSEYQEAFHGNIITQSIKQYNYVYVKQLFTYSFQVDPHIFINIHFNSYVGYIYCILSSGLILYFHNHSSTRIYQFLS